MRAPKTDAAGVASVNKNKGQSWAQRLTAGSDAAPTPVAKEMGSAQPTRRDRTAVDGGRQQQQQQQQGDRTRGSSF